MELTPHQIGLNVGSGQRPFRKTPEVSWWNIDKVHHDGMPEPDFLLDGSNLPYEDSAVDYFVLHHVMEHFGCGEAEHLVREAYRVLRPGGSLLVFVPDMNSLAVRWTHGSIDTQIFMTCVYGAYMGHDEDRHKWGYDFPSLHRSLRAYADWTEVKAFDWREIPGADCARDWWILGMEAIK